MRRIIERDSEFIYKLYNSEGFLKYIGDKNIHSNKAAKEYIQSSFQKMYQELSIGMYRVSLKDCNTAIGVCGILKRSPKDDYEIGFGFLPEYYGKGYAYESSQYWLNFARINLNLKRITAITSHDNRASQSLLEKLKMKKESSSSNNLYKYKTIWK